MAKFIIACPVCGNYTEGKTGLFARKKIECACGNVINVRTDKMSVAECPHCSNQIIYDQTKGTDLKCPVCKKTFSTVIDQDKTKVFSCEKCGVRLMASAGEKTKTCPVCDCVNNVEDRLTSDKLSKKGTAVIIRYEGDNSTFVWKHPIENINFGSQLIVHEGQGAIFFKDGQVLDMFGPGRHMIEIKQMPLLMDNLGKELNPEDTFHSEVYFINKTVQMGIKWGTPEKVRFIDPLTGTPLELGASGEMNIEVYDSRKLLARLVGTMKGIAWEDGPGLAKSLQSSFRPLITNAVKVNLPSVINKESIDILEIDTKLDIISERLREAIIPGFKEYGLTIPQFYVTNVVLPEDDPNFRRIRDLHTVTLQTRIYQAEATVKAAKAQSETLYRTAEEQSKAAIEAAHREAELERQTTETEIAKRAAERKMIEAQAAAQAKRMDGLADAEIMQAKGYNQKDVLQADVQKAYVENLGSIGSGPSGSGNSIVGDMLGISVGMAAANAIAPQLNNMMQGLTPQMQQPVANTWDCTCGQKGITGNFCSNCGSRKPTPAAANTWDCACGQKGITGNFCSNCGAKRPDVKPATWDCTCGRKGITGNFCDNCGKKRED